MPDITIYHNPNFLAYRGEHSQIALPTQPVATVCVPDGLSPTETLAAGYVKTQHLDAAWFNNLDVTAHLRSTATGDLIALSDGSFYVVEAMGFQPYQPKVTTFSQQLAEACLLLKTAVSTQTNTSVADGADDRLPEAVHRAIATIECALAAEEYQGNRLPVSWQKAVAGDLVGTEAVGIFRVIARKLHPKWRARQLSACIPDARLWIDGPRTWAVLVPVNEEKVR